MFLAIHFSIFILFFLCVCNGSETDSNEILPFVDAKKATTKLSVTLDEEVDGSILTTSPESNTSPLSAQSSKFDDQKIEEKKRSKPRSKHNRKKNAKKKTFYKINLRIKRRLKYLEEREQALLSLTSKMSKVDADISDQLFQIRKTICNLQVVLQRREKRKFFQQQKNSQFYNDFLYHPPLKDLMITHHFEMLPLEFSSLLFLAHNADVHDKVLLGELSIHEKTMVLILPELIAEGEFTLERYHWLVGRIVAFYFPGFLVLHRII